MNIVLFLGAGFSAPFGQPVMNRFMQYALGRLGTQDQQFLIELLADARQANSMVESSPTNLEEILSFAVMGDRLGLYGESDDPRAPKLTNILRRIYGELLPNQIEGYWSRYKNKLNRLLGFKSIDDFKSLAIVTTNYDLNIESSLIEHGVRASLPFLYKETYSPNRDNYKVLYEKDGIPLFKLHGSINWFEHDDGSVEVVGSVENTRLGAIPYACMPDYKNEASAMIIPPTFLKPDLSSTMAKVWQGAGQALNTAEIVVFVGYSFPASDVEMKYFLGRSLSDNLRLQKIIICDPNATDIVNRLRDASTGFGSHFKHFLRKAEGEWEKMLEILRKHTY